jgi:ABC-type proline/glycine betaine transport system permease subunit
MRDAAEKIEDCAKRHGNVLNNPPPQVLFEDFADSAQILTLYFWVEVSDKISSSQVASDLRFMIDKRFADDGIVIAFPQRDVRVDPSRPIRVEMVARAAATRRAGHRREQTVTTTEGQTVVSTLPLRWGPFGGEGALVPIVVTASRLPRRGPALARHPARCRRVVVHVRLAARNDSLGSLSVVRHAEDLAELLGEPYGTLILTLSVATIEITTLGIVMTTGEPNPELARDTMFSVVILCMNGLIGLSLILGALRYKEQNYNLRGANAYLSVIVSLAVFGLVVPNYTFTTPGPTFSRPQETFLIIMCVGLYAVFLAIQTTRHRSFFIEQDEAIDEDRKSRIRRSPRLGAVRRHVAFLVGYLVVVIYLVEKLAVLLDHGLEKLGAPPAFGALVVAALVLARRAWAASRPRSRTGCSGPSTSCWGRCSRRSRSPSLRW